ncbi:MAG: hypothetical protein JJU19_11910 [Pararhodobacter sp.]|nr:hypothetical protein [Pararhodobacter sp.]
MWLSDRRSFLTLMGSAGLLAGCGFTPVYGPQGAGGNLMGTIRADDPADRRDFQFVAALEERLGRPVAARYTLAYRIDVTETERGMVRRFGATRNQMLGRLDYVLALPDGSEIAAGQVSANTAYSLTSTQLATLAAREDAELRLIRMLVDSLVARLMLEPALMPA